MSKTIKNILRKQSIIYILNLFFLKYLKLKKILSPEIPGPGRFFMAGPDDIFIISYPKSGNTWLRFLIANLIFEKEKVNLPLVSRKYKIDVSKELLNKLDSVDLPYLIN